MYRDVVYGFAVPVLASIVKLLPGEMVHPCGLAAQFALTRTGERVLKDRLTHDLSHSITQYDASVNMRSDIDAYPEMIYGWCLMRIIHFICALRLQYPHLIILIAKFDFSDAHKRISHCAKTALETILIVGTIAFVMRFRNDQKVSIGNNSKSRDNRFHNDLISIGNNLETILIVGAIATIAFIMTRLALGTIWKRSLS